MNGRSQPSMKTAGRHLCAFTCIYGCFHIRPAIETMSHEWRGATAGDRDRGRECRQVQSPICPRRGEVMMRTRTYSVLLAAAVLYGGAVLTAKAAASPQQEQAADPAAYAALKEAHDRRETFPPGFAGFSADVAVN